RRAVQPQRARGLRPLPHAGLPRRQGAGGGLHRRLRARQRRDAAPAGGPGGAAEPLLLAVGRLHAAKGFDLAVEAVGRLAARDVAARLIVVGDGPERDALAALARERGVADRVELRAGMA